MIDAHLEKAKDAGRDDALTWLSETPTEQWGAALAPGCLGADEALINAMGVDETRKLLGVPNGEGWGEYLHAYSLAWANRVLEAIEALK